MTAKRHVRSLVIETLRDDFGKIYSQVRDRNLKPESRYHECVVIDRQRGRQFDSETVQRRAEAMAELLALPFVIDLSWPCRAKMGYDDCRCPECAESSRKRCA